MRKFYSRLSLILLTTFFSYLCDAQVSVTATAGTTGPTSYTTLKAAFDAINAGIHKGSVTIGISANTTEAASAVLNASGSGSATYSGVTIRPTATVTVSGSIAGPLVDLNGADNVTLDGRIGGTGTTRSLTISNTSTSGNASTSTTRMINSAQNDTLTYLNLQGSSVYSGPVTGVVLIDSTLTGTGNTGITISNNDIGPAGTNLPSIAIYSVGESATLMNSATVSNNLIHDFFNPAGVSAGLLADTWSNAFTVTGNSFYQTATRTSTANILHAGIYMLGGNNHSISANFIGGTAANAGGTPETINGSFSNRYCGMLLNVGTTTASNIDGNTITNINFSSTPAANVNAFAGIEVDAGNVNIGTTTGNTIGSMNATGNVIININSANTSYNDGIVSFSTGTVNVRNNNMGSVVTNGGGAGTAVLRGIAAYNYTSFTADGNTIGSTNGTNIMTNNGTCQLGGIFASPGTTGATATINNNIIRNFSNLAGFSSSAQVYGINAQINANSIAVTFNITNNQLISLAVPNGSAPGSIFGITTGAGSTTGSTAAVNINNNSIATLFAASSHPNFVVRGIQAGTDYTVLNINNNTIHGLSSTSPNTTAVTATVAVQGIASSVASAGTVSISGNTIYDLLSNAFGTYVAGIGILNGDNTNAATISKNKIYDLRITNGTSASLVSGLIIRGTNTGTFNVNNNMISLSPATVPVVGIHNNALATAINAYYNTVYIAGTATGTNSSTAFFRNMPTTATAATAVDVRNNIFYNVRTGGTGTHGAVSNVYTTPASGWVSNYNDLYSTTAATIALWGTSSMDLATYKTTAGDANSKSVTVTFTNTTTGDLHLSGASLTDVNLNSSPITGITTDYDNDPRNATTPKMGADEPCVPPVITTQPTAQTVCAGTTLNISVVGSGNNYTYQWRKGGTNITGATSATYTVANAATSDAGSYDVVVTNSCGSVTSNTVAVVVNAAPGITSQPSAASRCLGTSVTFSVTASGSGLTYQWRKGGTNITGANTSNYTKTGIVASDAGNYDVVISNGTCSVTSNVAALTVSGPCTAVPDVNADITSVVMTPNVIRDNANVRIISNKAMKLTWIIIDAQGKVVMTVISQVAPGKNDILLYVGQLPNGIYQLKGATNEGLTNVIRFVKM